MELTLPFAPTPDLARWDGRADSPGVERGPGPGDAQDAFERVIAREPPGPPVPGGPLRRAGDAVLRYDVFPPWLIRPVLRRSPVAVGDLVGIWFRPVAFLPGLFFAARVTRTFDGPRVPGGGVWRVGFTYRTLAGHPELGEETFAAEKELQTGLVQVALRSWSRPGQRLTRLGTPFTRLLQLRANELALGHLARRAGGDLEGPSRRRRRAWRAEGESSRTGP